MASDRPNFLKAAFLNVYNLGLLGGALAAGALTGDAMLAFFALGAEALWLIYGPGLRPFQRAVTQAQREDREREEEKRVQALMDNLPQREWQRAKALFDLRKEIERDMQQNPTFQAILLQTELDKLSQLHQSFVQLASACARAESYLAATDPRELSRQIDIQRGVEKASKDPAAQELARKNIEVLRKRQGTMEEIQNFLSRARGQMNLIENTVRLLRDQVLTMASPDQLGEQLDDLIVGVDAIQASARDHQMIFDGDLQAISPLPAEAEAIDPAPVRARTRG